MTVTDLCNTLIKGVNARVHLVVFFMISCVERVYARMIGVELGKGCLFRGWCSIFRTTGSRISIGRGCKFNSSGYTNHIGLNHRCVLTTMQGDASLSIGDDVGMSSTTITVFWSVDIGNRVRIGANCVIMDGDFHLEDPRTAEPRPVKICDNVWLGYGVVVKGGVTIGENSVIGINSVVTRDIPANCVAAGSPCKVVRTLDTK